MIPDMTARTRLGAVDLVPFLKRDQGEQGVELRDWERRPAALALSERKWGRERIAHATGLRVHEVDDVLADVPTPQDIPAPVETQTQKKSALRNQRAAERVLIDGRMVHPQAPHGTSSGYKHWGCRCDACRAAKQSTRPPTAKSRAGRHYEHGTYYSYRQGGCRCVECVAAGREYGRAKTAARRAERVEVDGRLVHPKAPHGTLNGYSAYGCRCEPCFNVQSEANRKRRRKEG